METQQRQLRDRVMTPDWCAQDMVAWFRPEGRILEPCRGDGAIFKRLPPGSLWCEIAEGRDFYAFTDRVDWIISNPPYSQLRPWMRHSFTLADEIVYLIPLRNLVSGFGFIQEVYAFGGIRHIRFYGTGNRLGFPMGNAICAIQISRGYPGAITVSFYGDEGATEGVREDEIERLAATIFDYSGKGYVRPSEEACHAIARAFLGGKRYS